MDHHSATVVRIGVVRRANFRAIIPAGWRQVSHWSSHRTVSPYRSAAARPVADDISFGIDRRAAGAIAAHINMIGMMATVGAGIGFGCGRNQCECGDGGCQDYVFHGLLVLGFAGFDDTIPELFKILS